jgi:hypothetical protein
LPDATRKGKALAVWSQGRHIGMTRSFDLVRKDGTVVNQDGDGARDIL